LQYSRRFPLKKLDELTPKRQKQVSIAANLEDMTKSQGWKEYEKWLEEQYLFAVNRLKTCKPEELAELQITVKIVEDLKEWMTATIERGTVIRQTLLSETTEGK